jgi:glycosyltransferase involved in cell wall biosynthesis
VASYRIGVVAIGRNEGQRLRGCLASVKGSAGQVVYVDSGSTDESVAIAEQIDVAIVQLEASSPFTAARARNEGFARLKTLSPEVEFVQFVDGDCELAAGWIDVACKFMAEQVNVGAVCGRRRERYPQASIYNRLCDLEWNTPVGEALACGGDAMMRVQAYEAAGGFQSRLVAGEEPELCVRLRALSWKIWRLDCDMTYHDAAMKRFGQWWRRAARSGYGYADVVRLSRGSNSRLYRKELVSTALWGGVLPVAILLGTIADVSALWALVVYPLQIVRIAAKRGPNCSVTWAYAVLIMLAKFAQFQGLLSFWWSRRQGHVVGQFDYKTGSH